jgi:hypothetical protein
VSLSYRAAPAFTNTGSTGVTSTSVTKQAGTTAGDWIFIYVFAGTASMACTGFTSKPDANGFGGLLYRLADGSEGSSFSVTGLAGNRASTMIVTVAGAAATLDPATVATPTSGGAGTSIAVASITLANSTDWCLWFCANQNGYSGAGMAITPPSGFTSQGTNGALASNATIMLADNESIASGATGTKTGTFTSSTFYSGVMAGLTPAAGTSHPGTAALTGLGTLTGLGVFAGTAALSGIGTLSGTATHVTGHGAGTAALTGIGTLSALPTGVFIQAAALSGIGTLSAAWTGILLQPPAVLSGTGTLNLSGYILSVPAGLSGNGTLSVLQATGGLVFASPGATVPYAYPLSSQVMVAPPGTSAWRPLGSVGAVTALTYSFTCPGGADKMTATVMAPAAYRTQLFNPGWQVKITRGGHQVWSGRLDEPQPSAGSGWTLTAVGTGNRGTDFTAVYTSTWPSSEPDQAINAAIGRGLNWINPGVGTPSGAWFGQAPDSGSTTITGLLNLICTRGGLTWYVNSQPGGIPGDDLAVFPLPTVANRLLVCTQPVGRTLGGDINTIQIRYQVSADDPSGSGAAAVYAVTSVTSAASVAAHGVIETYIDLSSAGVMSAGAAQAVGTKVLAIYQRASFAGPFTARYGQLTTTGGVPVDPGCDQAGTVVKLVLVDFGYGGEIVPGPISFLVGGYEWNDLDQTATITPYQNVNQSLTGLLSLASQGLTPITAA